jgi:hypothetical protein
MNAINRRRAPALVSAALLSIALLVAGDPVAAVPKSAPERSTQDDLVGKRWVAAGDRAYAIGAQDGTFVTSRGREVQVQTTTESDRTLVVTTE